MAVFFQADMAGLGKYHMGGYGRIGVNRDKEITYKGSQSQNTNKLCPNLKGGLL